MTSPRTDKAAKAIALALYGALAALVAISGFQQQKWDSDIFWALRSGRWIVENLKVPDFDPFSYTFGGMPWIDFTWGFQVLAHLFYTYLGQWTGLYLLQTILVAATFVFLYVTIRSITAGRQWLAVALLFAAFAASQPRLFIRPHLFEYFFVSLFFMLLTLYESSGRRACLYLLVPAQVLWINAHSSSILGIFMVGSYAAGEIIERGFKGGLRGLITDKPVSLAAAAVLMPAVSLLNPYGLKLLLLPFMHQGVDNADAIRHIEEWSRPDLKEFLSLYPFPVDRFSVTLLAAAIVLTFIAAPGRARVRSLFLLAGALYMAASHVRWVPLFAFFAAPIAAEGLSALSGRAEGRRFFRWAALAAPLFLAIVLANTYLGPSGMAAGNRGLGLAPARFPVGTVEFMRRNGVGGRIYNDYVFGGYLIHELPETKVFIDGRTPTVYSPYFFWTSRVAEDRGRWARLEAEHAIDTVLIKPESNLCSTLRSDPAWTPVAVDEVAVLFVKKGAYPELSKNGFAAFDPCPDGASYRLPDDRDGKARALAELESNSASAGRSARVLRLKALLRMRLGEHAAAASDLKEALSIREDSNTFYDLGVALKGAGKTAEAAAAFEEALDRKPDHREAAIELGMAYHESGMRPEAIAALERYLELSDDEAEPRAYKALGMAWFKEGGFEKAAVYLKRAAFLMEKDSSLAEAAYYLGSAYFELGDFNEGASWYGRALESDPGYGKVLTELANTRAWEGRAAEAEYIRSIPRLIEK